MTSFAPEYPRDENDWILFPRDTEFRRELFFPPEVMEHPAKMNLHLQQSIVEYVGKTGNVLLDPFGGTGSLMIAALQGMRVVLIDIEQGYHELQAQAVRKLEEDVPEAKGFVTLIRGDNRIVMPIPCNHVITSPPYAQAMNIQRVRKKREDAPDDWLVQQDIRMSRYSKDKNNIGRLNTFLYNQNMEKVYRLCYQSLLPGGSMTIIIKDRIDDGERTYLSKWVERVCKRIGFKDLEWYKWKTPGHGFTKIAASQGKQVVWDEDIMIFWKE